MGKQMLIAAWEQYVSDATVDLDAYATAAVTPLLPDNPSAYFKMKNARAVPRRSSAALTAKNLQATDEDTELAMAAGSRLALTRKSKDDDGISTVGSTNAPDDSVSTLAGDDHASDWVDPEEM